MAVSSVSLRLSLQTALLGNVSSRLRAVCTNSEGNTIYLYFYYDGEISEKDEELSHCAVSDVISDFHVDDQGNEIEFNITIKRVDYPKKLELFGDWVYYRSE